MRKKINKIIINFIIISITFTIISPLNTIANRDNIHLLSINKNDLSKDKLYDWEINLLMRLGHIPSLSACIIKNNSIVQYYGYGYSKLLIREKPTKDSIYLIYCIAKTFTATAIMQLYDKGLFNIDDDINNYLDFKVRNPNYPDIPITFRMLLAHQSSLSEVNLPKNYLIYYYLKYLNQYPYPMIKDLITPNGSLYRSEVWKNIPPGSDCEYIGLDMILLEHLIEKLSKQKYIDYCKENIFNPLNMSNTGFHIKDLKRNLLAVSYEHIGGLYFRLPFIEGFYGTFGLRTSIEDLSHYVIAYMNKGVWNSVRILNESTIDMMHEPQYPDSIEDKAKYGLGWFNWTNHNSGLLFYGHRGIGIGVTTAMYINNSNDWAILYFINTYVHFNNKLEKKVHNILEDILFKARNF